MTRAQLRALPTMLRVGFNMTVAYRAEMVVWVFSYTLPLVMMALWTAVARDAPVGGWDQPGFVAYFTVTLVVRMVVASWIVWELNWYIRQGTLAGLMLRPINPLVSFAMNNLAAVPLRLVIGLPLAALAFAFTGFGVLSSEPLHWAALPVALILAWTITFMVQACVAMLAFWWESSLSIYNLFMAFYIVCSGYVVPLDLFPGWFAELVAWLPFRYMLSFPVELIMGLQSSVPLGRSFAMQVAYAVVMFALTAMIWRRGARNFAAYGG